MESEFVQFKQDKRVLTGYFPGELKFTIEILEEKQYFSFHYNYAIKSYTLIANASGGNILRLLQHDNRSHVIMFLPTGVKVRSIKGVLQIRGKMIATGHKAFVFFETFHEIQDIKPLMANNQMYPDNTICGFKVSSGQTDYILFFHSQKKDEIFKGCEAVPRLLFTFLKFVNNDLDKVLYI